MSLTESANTNRGFTLNLTARSGNIFSTSKDFRDTKRTYMGRAHEQCLPPVPCEPRRRGSECDLREEAGTHNERIQANALAIKSFHPLYADLIPLSRDTNCREVASHFWLFSHANNTLTKSILRFAPSKRKAQSG